MSKSLEAKLWIDYGWYAVSTMPGNDTVSPFCMCRCNDDQVWFGCYMCTRLLLEILSALTGARDYTSLDQSMASFRLLITCTLVNMLFMIRLSNEQLLLIQSFIWHCNIYWNCVTHCHCVNVLRSNLDIFFTSHWPENITNSHVSAYFRKSLEALLIYTYEQWGSILRLTNLQ